MISISNDTGLKTVELLRRAKAFAFKRLVGVSEMVQTEHQIDKTIEYYEKRLTKVLPELSFECEWTDGPSGALAPVFTQNIEKPISLKQLSGRKTLVIVQFID
jgi:hypothetical protein